LRTTVPPYQDGISEAAFPAFAQAGRQFPVLTYWKYAPRIRTAVAFPSALLRTGLDEPFERLRACFFEPTQSLWDRQRHSEYISLENLIYSNFSKEFRLKGRVLFSLFDLP